MLTNKEVVTEDEVIALSAKCSSLVKKNIRLPKKLKDPGSCNIQCMFDGNDSYQALCDLGSGVSLMPRRIAQYLDIMSEMKYTSLRLQLVARSVIKPQKVIEDVCIGVGKFILPCDFMIIDVEIDKDIPLILGRPFLSIGDAWIGARDKIIVFQVNGERIVLNVDKEMKQPAQPEQVHQMDSVEQCVKSMLEFLVQRQNS